MPVDRVERFRNAVGDERSPEVSPRVQAELALVLLENGLARHRAGAAPDAPLDLAGLSGPDASLEHELLVAVRRVA